MSIESVIKRFAKQTAVYWGNPIEDGFGGYDYDDPVEIKCRWSERITVLSNDRAEAIICTSTVLTNSELEEQGVLYLGTLDDLLDLNIPSHDSSDAFPQPKDIDEGAYRIVARKKVYMPRSTTDCMRLFYLSPKQRW